MTKPDLTAIALIVDRSGSMESIRSDAQGAINAFIRDQEAQPGEVLWSVTLFDDQILRPVFMDKATPSVELAPRRMTALHDAVGTTISKLGEALAAMDEGERPGKVIIVIVTDGLENASQEYNAAGVRALVERQAKEWQWEFVYLSAGLDRITTVHTAADMGIPRHQTVSAGAGGQSYGMGTRAVSGYVSDLRANASASLPDEVVEENETE